MVFQSLEFTNKAPFNDVLIHGLIRDKEGRKMSKSLGNGVDPMDVIEDYGTDALRFFLSTSTAPGMDLRYDEEKVKSTWNFINKLWNASRFVMMNLENYSITNTLSNLSATDKWILNKLNNTIKTVRNHMEKYEFNLVGTELYNFIWNDFCDWYIELSKIDNNSSTKETLYYVLVNILKMLHPFMPYVTEEIYTTLTNDETIMLSNYPQYKKDLEFNNTNEIDEVISLITKVRKIKLENNISKEFNLESKSEIFNNNFELITKMLKNNSNENGYSDFIEIPFIKDVVSISYDGSKNKENELELLTKEKERLEKSIERREKLLSNTGYVNNAPVQVVDKERNDLAIEIKELELINNKLK